ncbi:hypothetical protein OFC37_34090, partial [Escherichia coli]|nr:hypothetical protein [Escherichia coli]
YRWLQTSSEADPSVLATVIGGGDGRVWVRPDRSVEGRISPPDLHDSVVRAAGGMLAGGSRPTTRYIGEAEVFFDLSSPVPELV